MLRYQTTIVSLLASALVVPVFLGQGSIATLQDALAGTQRALEVLRGLEQRLQLEPAAALGLVLAATEVPAGDEQQRERRHETLRNEVNLLQMELDSMLSPMLGPDGAVQSALGARLAAGEPVAPQEVGVTTGLDDALRALLGEAPATRALLRGEPLSARERATRDELADPSRTAGTEGAYSADPLRHGVACYRAGRYAEALELLAPLDEAGALYWRARTLERLERLDDAVTTMERALAKGGEGFDQRRAQTDLEFLRWKRDFMKNLPARSAAAGGKEPR